MVDNLAEQDRGLPIPQYTCQARLMLSDLHFILNYCPQVLKNYSHKHIDSGLLINYPIFDLNGCRFALPNIEALSGKTQFKVVGFCGTEKALVPPKVKNKVILGDLLMLSRLERQNGSGVCAYLTYYLSKLQTANCILFYNQDAVNRWKKRGDHEDLAKIVAPDNYDYIDIFHGSLTKGLKDITSLQIDSHKHIDFRTTAAV